MSAREKVIRPGAPSFSIWDVNQKKYGAEIACKPSAIGAVAVWLWFGAAPPCRQQYKRSESWWESRLQISSQVIILEPELMMGGIQVNGFQSAQATSERWGVSERRVIQYCTEGRVPGAVKFGKRWAIPIGADKPGDLRKDRQVPSENDLARQLLGNQNLMPLMNTAFAPGRCLATAERMEPGLQRDIALAEYHYFSGQPEAAAMETERYLKCDDLGARLSACLLFAYANLSLGRIQQARFALHELNTALADSNDSPEVRAASAFVAAAGAVLLHLPLPEGLPDIRGFLPLLPPGLRAFALYVYAHFLYLQKEYGASLGLVEGALAMSAGQYPIPAIYLHLVAVMDAMSLKQTDRARSHLLAAWDLARPDDLIEGFGEHHGLLGGMLESVIKPRWPEDFKRIIEITYRFSSGWRKVHNPITGHDVADDLTTTEFAVCMLAARGWNSQDIADLLHISVSTVKKHIAAAKEKLGVSHRKDLQQYMLQ